MVGTHFRLHYAQMSAVYLWVVMPQQDGLAWAQLLTTTENTHIFCWKTPWTCSSDQSFLTPQCVI